MDEHRWLPRSVRPPGLVRPAPLDPTGRRGPTRGQAAGPRYRQTSAGLYVPAAVDGGVVEQRIVEQASRIRSYGAVTAWAALRWHGAAFFDGSVAAGTRRLPVPIVLGPARLRPDPRVALSQEQLAVGELVWIDGVPVTTPERAIFDEVRRRASLREGVVALEMAVAAGLVTLGGFAAYVVTRQAWTGVPLTREVSVLAGGECLSPPEARLRLVWMLDCGLPPPVCNRPVFDLRGNLLGIPDLFDPEAGLVGEYDGAHHKSHLRHRRDVAREERFRNHGLEYFVIVGGDLSDGDTAVRRIHRARARARFLPAPLRGWTLDPPAWWTYRHPGHTLSSAG